MAKYNCHCSIENMNKMLWVSGVYQPEDYDGSLPPSWEANAQKTMQGKF
jgi:hypothetical protein